MCLKRKKAPNPPTQQIPLFFFRKNRHAAPFAEHVVFFKHLVNAHLLVLKAAT